MLPTGNVQGNPQPRPFKAYGGGRQGSETIPNGSTPENQGEAPRTLSVILAEGDDIVRADTKVLD